MKDKIVRKEKKQTKSTLLVMSLLFDAIGMVSFVIPGIGEFTDIIWAPISAYLIIKMYKGTAGKVGGFVALLEEGLFGFDIIPTFTIMWIYKYVIKKGKI